VRATSPIIRNLIAIVAIASALLLVVAADSSMAKKKKPVFKPGTYFGVTQDGAVGFEATKKKVTALFLDFNPPCYLGPFIEFLPPPSYAGASADIKVKKVGLTGKKKKGVFQYNHQATNGFVRGELRGKKAEGVGLAEYTNANGVACHQFVDWEAKRQ
jgi:hypothetical protein